MADQAKIVCCSHLRSFQFCSFNFLLEFSSCANKLSNMLAVLCFPVQNYCSLDFTATFDFTAGSISLQPCFLEPELFPSYCPSSSQPWPPVALQPPMTLLTETHYLGPHQNLHQQQPFNNITLNSIQQPLHHSCPVIRQFTLHHPSLELLLLSWMFDTLFMLVTRTLEHPIAAGPIPDPSFFADNNAHHLFYQFHRRLSDLGKKRLYT